MLMELVLMIMNGGQTEHETEKTRKRLEHI